MKKILVVEDESSIRELIVLNLKMAEYEIVEAANAEDALTLFSQYSKQGRALRAVADDHQAALSVGISLRFIWVMVWPFRWMSPEL